MNLLRALGIYKKSNLLDQVLKMYKTATGDYNEYQTNPGPFSGRGVTADTYDALGNPTSLEQTTIADSKYVTNKQNRTIQSPQPIHKRLITPPVKVGGAKNIRGVTQGNSKRNFVPIRQEKQAKNSSRGRNQL